MPHLIDYDEQVLVATEDMKWAVQDAITRVSPNSPLKNARYVRIFQSWHASPGDPRVHITFTAFSGSFQRLNNYHGYHPRDPLNNAKPSKCEQSENWDDDRKLARQGVPMSAPTFRPSYRPTPTSMRPSATRAGPQNPPIVSATSRRGNQPALPPMRPTTKLGRQPGVAGRDSDARSSYQTGQLSTTPFATGRRYEPPTGKIDSRSFNQQVSIPMRSRPMQSEKGDSPMQTGARTAQSHSNIAGIMTANSSTDAGGEARSKADGSLLKHTLVGNMHQSNTQLGSIEGNEQNSARPALTNEQPRREPLGQRIPMNGVHGSANREIPAGVSESSSVPRRGSILGPISEEQENAKALPVRKSAKLADDEGWTKVQSTRSRRRKGTAM
ncbi:hypothetical protein FKW77_001679 [Venturia effusa]|uniref:Uncharacterized protein n=1 Tax=Venturia effusa TaxID=50376 RepID=A0A517LPL2_9PEZI|nr:hypothetical protein FKW77_001679 [Venturia effusa]